jgi:hypothetical protein
MLKILSLKTIKYSLENTASPVEVKYIKRDEFTNGRDKKTQKKVWEDGREGVK